MSRNMVMLEVGVKTCIIFIIVGFIDYKMKDYLVNNYGYWWYIGFLITLYGCAFTGQHFYFKNRIRRIIKENFFGKYREQCSSFYNTSKKELLADCDKFYMAPFPLIHALGVHEHLIENYSNGELVAEYIKEKHKLLVALCNNDGDAIMEGIGRMKHILSQIEFMYKP